MCGSPHKRYSNEREFINHIKSRVENRFDSRQFLPKGRERDYPDFWYQSRAVISYAYSVRDEYFYVGYSGSAGGMSRDGRKIESSQSERRVGRLSDAGLNPLSRPELDRPICNCAEACAASIALAYNQRIEDLFFVTFYPREGQATQGGLGIAVIKGPCENCLTWIRRRPLGYCNANGELVCNRRSDRDDDDRGKKRKFTGLGAHDQVKRARFGL